MSKERGKEKTFWPVDPVAVSIELPVNGALTLLKGDEVRFRFHGAAMNGGVPLGFALQALGFSFQSEGNDIVMTAKVRKETRTFGPAEVGVNKMKARLR